MSDKAQNFVTWLLMTVGFISMLYFLTESQVQQDECDKACSPRRAITPVINFKSSCFCEIGHGVWKSI